MNQESNDNLVDLLLRWEEAWEHGNDIPATELCSDNSELADSLQVRIDRLKKMSWMTQ